MVTPHLFGGGKRLVEPGFCRLDLLSMGSPALGTGVLILHLLSRTRDRVTTLFRARTVSHRRPMIRVYNPHGLDLA
jgi:hypothetical protein